GLEAVARLSVQAVAADPAGWPTDDDLVARRHFGDARADLFDHAGAFMAQHAGEGHRHVAGPGDRIGVADTAGNDTHQDFPTSRFLEIQLLENKRAVLLLYDQRADFHFILQFVHDAAG